MREKYQFFHFDAQSSYIIDFEFESESMVYTRPAMANM